MRKIGIYGDVHLTRKMGNLQSHWDSSAISVFNELYDKFDEKNVECAICLGDFFDQPRLEAKSVSLVTKVLDIINSRTFPTFFLLGNHEIFDDESNILDYLYTYDNIIPVTEFKHIEGLTFIPYNFSIEEVPNSYINNQYVFTHHDIYGSALSGGIVRANFGIDPAILSPAKHVFNGHIHLNSAFSNITNVGSLLKSHQGELSFREVDYPVFYILDRDKDTYYEKTIQKNFIAPLTLPSSEIDFVLSQYDPSVKVILRVLYDNEQPSMVGESLEDPRIIKMSYKKSIGNSVDHMEEDYQRRNFLDVKELITRYIQRDDTVEESSKSRITELSLSMLEV